MKNFPVHRSIVGIDVEKSTGPLRTNPVKEEIRRELYRMTGEALAYTGIGEDCREPFEDRGDGLLALIHPNDAIPKVHLLTRLIPELVRQLNDYDLSLPVEERPRRSIRLRAVVHAGEVHRDREGYFGEALDVACRMLDAPRFKRGLRHAASTLALVVSEEIYWSVVHHGYDGLQPESFNQDFCVTVGGRRHRAWIHLPGEDGGEARSA